MGDKKTTTAATTSTTPNVPQWGVDSLQNLNGSINSIAGTDPSKFVTGASPLQQQAQAGAGALGGWQGTANDAKSTIDGVTANPIQGQSLLTGLQDYMSPYTNDVVKSSLADYDQNAARTRAAEEAQGAAAGAFGGSRFGVQQASTLDNQDRARATLDSGLRDAAFTTGAGLSNDDAGRRQAAATSNASNGLTAGGLLTGLAGTQDTNARADIATQDQMGQEQRDISQAQATAPITQAQVIAALLGQSQLGLLTGQSGTSNSTQTVSDPMGTISGILSGVGAAASGVGALNKSGGLSAMFG